MSFLFSLLLGFLFGLRHGFDADHLSAMAILNSSAPNKKSAVFRGIYWGLGHTFVLLVIGVAIFILGIYIPPQFNVFFEKIAAIFLIILGTKALYDFWKNRRVKIIHDHPPIGLHAHAYPSFFVGMLHGLAGSAAILIVFVATIKSAVLALLYILIFGLGTMGGMVFFSVAFNFCARFFKKYTALVAGAVSCLVGIYMLRNL